MNKKERKYRDLCMRETRDPVKSLFIRLCLCLFLPGTQLSTPLTQYMKKYGKTRKRWCYIKEEGIWVDGDNENAPKKPPAQKGAVLYTSTLDIRIK
ncbi:hypothetical protein OUZ56_008301 [Daphnia magna]|uniref:Uncharacterized protein n=1 Tax=Daphnia magna TaxID=35525 RepID=A0ABR0ACK5_9CRUS|nr:hypothetical protein OUZ56_008301 [Daphnia magna]